MRIRILKLDETQFYSEEWRGKWATGTLYSVFLYDPDSATYLCEGQPSYELHYIGIEHDGETNEALFEELAEVSIRENDVDYIHVSRVKAMQTESLGEFEDMDDAIEYARGNGYTTI